jgi:hypothetical protein
MNFIKYVATVGLALALAACGGGGGNPGTPSGSPAAAASAPVAAVVPASFVFALDKSSISNGGGETALLTVTVLNASRNVLADVPVNVSVDSGFYTPIASKSDAAGQVTGKISVGAVKNNRIITATISIAGLAASTASVNVIGSQITLTPVPSTPRPGSSVQLAIKATDSNGAGVANTDIVLGGSLGFTQVVRTDAAGNATATLGAAPNVVGTYTVTAAGLGVDAARDVQVVSATGGIPDAVGVISSASLAISPNTISPNTVGSTTNRAALRAVFQTATNQAIPNVRVRFEIVPPLLGSGEQISTADNVIYSDVSGVAVADYIAGTRTSPTSGVTVRICYGLTDASIANGACPNPVTQTLTVTGQPLSVTLGDNNLLQKGGNSLTYIKLFDVAVADSSGNAVPNALISASVDLTDYGKGKYADDPRLWCPNEDTNRNGFLDTGEDKDQNGVLTPRKADVILSFVGSNTTAANGRATIQVEYPQNVATWLKYSVRVTTNVVGSEGTDQKSYVTSFIEGDDKNGSFLTPPYGVNNCSTAN